MSSPTPDAQLAADRRLRRRYRQERVFRAFALAAIGFALSALAGLLVSISYQSLSVITQSSIELDVVLEPDALDPLGDGSAVSLAAANYAKPVRSALRGLFPEVEKRRDRKALVRLLSDGAEYDLRAFMEVNPELIGSTQTFVFPLSDDVDLFLKGSIDSEVDEADRKISDQQIGWVETLDAQGRISQPWNWRFLFAGDSREPELAGLQGAIRGSMLTLLITFLLSFPIGVCAAVYLEEFAPKNRLTDVVEVNINNLAAVPSIIFGLLGLAVFLDAPLSSTGRGSGARFNDLADDYHCRQGGPLSRSSFN